MVGESNVASSAYYLDDTSHKGVHVVQPQLGDEFGLEALDTDWQRRE
ncbi:MAG: hypothetical protein WCA39_17775 [Nitrososphaeraceae archaeon]